MIFRPGDLVRFSYGPLNNVFLRLQPTFAVTKELELSVVGDALCLVVEVREVVEKMTKIPLMGSPVWYLLLSGNVVGYAWSEWKLYRIDA